MLIKQTPWLPVICLLGLASGAFVNEGLCAPPARLVVTARPSVMFQVTPPRQQLGLERGQLLVLFDSNGGKSDSPLGPRFVKARAITTFPQAVGWVDATDLSSVKSETTLKHDAVDLTVANASTLPEVIRSQSPEVIRAWREVETAIVENERLPEPLAEPFFARAEIFTIARDFDSALRDYLRAIQIASQSKDDVASYAAYFERLREALEDYDRMPRPPARGKAASHYAEGVHSYRSGDMESARKHFSNAIAVKEDVALYWYFRALTYKRMNQGVRAQHDMLIGSHLEWKDGAADQIGLALIYVQGELRRWLERYRLGDPTQQLLP